MSLNLKSEALAGGGTDKVLKDWAPTLNRWALKIENRLDEAHIKANQSPLVAKSIVTKAIAALPPATSAADPDDNLTHGDGIWWLDPSFVSLRDDFVHGAIATQEIGDLGWTLNTIGGGGTLSALGTGSAPPGLGNLAMDTGTSAGVGDAFTLGFSASSAQIGTWPLLDYPGWKLVWVFKFQRASTFTSTTAAFAASKMSFYAGVGNYVTNIAGGRPSKFVGLRFDTDTTAPAISDTTFQFENVFNINGARNNTQGSTFNTGVTPVENVEYRLEMLCTTAGTVSLSLFGNGAAVATTTFTITAPSTVISAGGAIATANGLTTMTANANPDGLIFGEGSKVSVALVGTGAMPGNPVTVYNAASGPSITVIGTGTAGSPTSVTLTGYPGLYPLISFANDTQAAPVSKTIVLDFFGFVWSSSLATSPQTLSASRSRYINNFGA